MTNEPTRVLIAGGGTAGLEALLALRELAGSRVEPELLSPRPDYFDRPLAVAEPFGAGEARRWSLGEIAADHGARLRLDSVVEVDTAANRVVTRGGVELAYDLLLLAVGARPGVALDGAVTLKGPGYTGRFRTVLRELEDRRIRRLAFAVPPGAAWPMPLYELALMTAARVAERGLRKVELRLVTPEESPLELFGRAASAAVRDLLEQRGIEVLPGHYPAAVGDDGLELVPRAEGPVPADRVVSLPRLRGRRIPGLPHDSDGFIPVDRHGLVRGEIDVYAAGDATTFPVKQGGLAAQMADAAAEAIAARAGAPVDPTPFDPVLRGLLLTGGVPRFMRSEVGGGHGERWDVSEQALWWPPAKIAARRLAPYLALRAGQGRHGEDPPTEGLPVERRLVGEPGAGIRRRTIIRTS